MLELNFTPFPNLTTERLLLRQLVVEDINEIFKLRSDERVNRYLGRPKANSTEDAGTFIYKINNGISNNELLMWAITVKDHSKLIGTIVYWNFSKEDRKAEIGYELDPDFQGKGIMQEALSTVIGFGFNQMKLTTIQAYTVNKNQQSVKLLENNNFYLDADSGIMEQNMNTVVYTLTKSKINNFPPPG